MTIFDDIKNCAGIDKCWGALNENFRKPVVVPPWKERHHPTVMIVTEQPNVKDLKRSNWDSKEDFLEWMCKSKNEDLKGESRIAKKISDDMFARKLLLDFDEKRKCFKKFYWTHFIKCPGRFRDKGGDFNVRRVNHNVCAKRFLLDEIKEIKPKLIITFGEHASTWVLDKANIKVEWTKQVWEEFKLVIRKEKVPIVDIAGVKTKLIVAPHPSPQNSASIFNEKIGTLVQDIFRHL